MESFKDHLNEPVWVESASDGLDEEEIRINHGVAEVALDVCHSLTLHLESIPRPESTQDLVEGDDHLKWMRQVLFQLALRGRKE